MCCSRYGYSLLEVVLAASLCATALVPALALIRDSMTLAETIDKRHLLTLYGVAKMEEQLSVVAATWGQGTTSGDFAAEGHPNLRFIVNSSDDAADGGIADRLMNVSVTIYCDDNGNDSLDSSELQTVLTTKIAKLMSYELKANS
jgi:hypothetical protein